MKRVEWVLQGEKSPALHQVATILNNDDFCMLIRDAVRLGRIGTLEEYDKNTPKFQRGQAAYLKICNQLRKALGRTDWAEEHPENQQCFVLPTIGDNLPVRLTYFAGRLEDERQFFRINPKGKLTKLSLAKNREQMTFLDEPGFFEDDAVPSNEPELTLFVMSAWDWKEVDDAWRIVIRTWIAFCDTPLNRRGKPQDENDEARFTRATIIAYRELDDFMYGGAVTLPDGPEPIKVSPIVLELSDVEQEDGLV